MNCHYDFQRAGMIYILYLSTSFKKTNWYLGELLNKIAEERSSQMHQLSTFNEVTCLAFQCYLIFLIRKQSLIPLTRPFAASNWKAPICGSSYKMGWMAQRRLSCAFRALSAAKLYLLSVLCKDSQFASSHHMKPILSTGIITTGST